MKELSDKERELLAKHWYAQHELKLEPLWNPREMSKRVPYNELPEAGAGAYFAEAIRGELGARGWSEDVSFSVSARGSRSGRPCMSCGQSCSEVSELGGWCSRCTNGE